jgi:hypothetical protein
MTVIADAHDSSIHTGSQGSIPRILVRSMTTAKLLPRLVTSTASVLLDGENYPMNGTALIQSIQHDVAQNRPLARSALALSAVSAASHEHDRYDDHRPPYHTKLRPWIANPDEFDKRQAQDAGPPRIRSRATCDIPEGRLELVRDRCWEDFASEFYEADEVLDENAPGSEKTGWYTYVPDVWSAPRENVIRW